LIPSKDSIGACIQQRAAEFQGFLSPKDIETLQVVQYTQNQEYRGHYDWGIKNMRETTIFGILEANCDECGTQFPALAIDWSKEDPRWCEIVECQMPHALTFKAIVGNAIFWRNLRRDGTGDRKTVHAGLPVRNGTKLGLNIWTQGIVP